ncbi:MAG: hypothetical protein KDE35_10595 [Geminicoccaceae bacterium]|nr:hypothetical protein [Geminicoccaceae bacterium]
MAVGALMVLALVGPAPATSSGTDMCDQANIVVSWQSRSDPRLDRPDIVLRGTGEVTIGERLAGGRARRIELTDDELRALLDFILDEKDAWSIDGEAIARAAREADPAGRGGDTLAVTTWPQADSRTTILTLDKGARSHVVEVDDLFGLTMRRPELDAAARLRAIELRLLDLARHD